MPAHARILSIMQLFFLFIFFANLTFCLNEDLSSWLPFSNFIFALQSFITHRCHSTNSLLTKNAKYYRINLTLIVLIRYATLGLDQALHSSCHYNVVTRPVPSNFRLNFLTKNSLGFPFFLRKNLQIGLSRNTPFLMPFNGRFLGPIIEEHDNRVFSVNALVFIKAKSSKLLPTPKEVRDNLELMGITMNMLTKHEIMFILKVYSSHPKPLYTIYQNLFCLYFNETFLSTLEGFLKLIDEIQENQKFVCMLPVISENEKKLEFSDKNDKIVVRYLPAPGTVLKSGEISLSFFKVPNFFKENTFWDFPDNYFISQKDYFILWSNPTPVPFCTELLDSENPLILAYPLDSKSDSEMKEEIECLKKKLNMKGIDLGSLITPGYIKLIKEGDCLEQIAKIITSGTGVVDVTHLWKK